MDSTARIFAIATGGASGGRRTAGGFAMLEVLITLLILLLGLLGLLGLMTRANTAELESYQRVQAVILMRDMFNRIESNRAVAGCLQMRLTISSPFQRPVSPRKVFSLSSWSAGS